MAPTVLSTGILIPVEKRSKFLLTFEEPLFYTYNIVPLFGKTKSKSCEVKFQYIKQNGRRPFSIALDSKRAKKFLNENLHVLDDKMRKPRRPLIIDLSDESPQVIKSSIDLTETQPEIIVLDETLTQLDQTISDLQVTVNDVANIMCVDTIRNPRCSREVTQDTESEVQVVCVKNREKDTSLQKTPIMSGTEDITILRSSSKLRKIKDNQSPILREVKHNKSPTISSRPNLSVTFQNKGPKQSRTVKRKKTESSENSFVNSVSTVHKGRLPPKKKRKLKDVSNNATVNSSLSKPLSANVLKYYSQIQKIAGIKNNTKKTKKRKSIGLQNNAQNQVIQGFKSRKTGMQEFKNRKNKKKHRKSFNNNSMKSVKETNIFNPNPIVVEKDGLRPVIIDGCNVAIGHGRGKFSVKGIQICVDYFVSRGHDHVKVFLPLHRQEHFTEQELAQLKTKCDVVFTPSRCVDGVIKTSYDDRFIVQYAVEFEGVIVSTDNYRDLLMENPRWKETIEQRLLMFTWVDDFLMFPMDPLGRSGPTLEQFLKF